MIDLDERITRLTDIAIFWLKWGPTNELRAHWPENLVRSLVTIREMFENSLPTEIDYEVQYWEDMFLNWQGKLDHKIMVAMWEIRAEIDDIPTWGRMVDD